MSEGKGCRNPKATFRLLWLIIGSRHFIRSRLPWLIIGSCHFIRNSMAHYWNPPLYPLHFVGLYGSLLVPATLSAPKQLDVAGELEYDR